MKLPPNIGDRIVIGDWVQFPTTVNCVETLDDGRTCIYVTTEYPEDDPFFKRKIDRTKVYLKDEGSSWHRFFAHSKLN